MQRVSNQAARILDKITSDISEEKTSKKIDNSPGAYMAVCVERIGEVEGGDLVSVAHYYEQNGDLMADPDVVFLRKKVMVPDWPSQYAYYPVSYRQDNLGIDRELVTFEDSKPVRYSPAQQKDTAQFSTDWMRNIKMQQKL